jgi:tetratricopeptide (TPR) repeat protein
MEEWKVQIAQLVKEGRIQEAIDRAREVAQRTGEYDAVAYSLINIGVEIGNKGGLFSVPPLFEAAEEMARGGEVKDLAKRNLALAHLNCGAALHDNGRYAPAEEHYRRALQLDPGSADAHYHYGTLLQLMRRYGEAEEQYKEAIRKNPKNVKALNNYALVLQELGRYKEAENHYKEVLHQNPNLAEAHFNYGFLLYSQGRYKEAEEHYKLALKINPNLAQAHNNYALLLNKLGRFREAERHYKEAIRLDSRNANAHFNYGLLLHYELKRYADAEKHYAKALSIEPGEIAAHFNYGTLLIELKRYPEAEGHYREVYRMSHENGDLATSAIMACTLGFLLILSSRLGEAKSWFEKARQESMASGEWRQGPAYMLGWIKVVEALEAYKKGRWEACESALKAAEDDFYDAQEGQEQYWASRTRVLFSIDSRLALIADTIRGGETKDLEEEVKIISGDVNNLLALRGDQAWSQLMHAKLRCVKRLMDLIERLIRSTELSDIEPLHGELEMIQDTNGPFRQYNAANRVIERITALSIETQDLLKGLRGIEPKSRIARVSDFLKMKGEDIAELCAHIGSPLTELIITSKVEERLNPAP